MKLSSSRFRTNKKIIIQLCTIIFLLFVTNDIYSIQQEWFDTVNIRKAFFEKETNWDKFLNEIKFYKLDQHRKVGFICKKDEDFYELMFYPVMDDPNQFHTFGRISYRFTSEKKLESVKLFYQKNNNSYLYFHVDNPQKFKVYLFGKLYHSGLTYYFPIESLKIMNIPAILAILKRYKLDKEIIITEDDSPIKSKLIDLIIKPGLEYQYHTDGALNQHGNFRMIDSLDPIIQQQEGLNCSGFVKEVAENLIRLKVPDFRRFSIEELKERRIEDRSKTSYNHLETELDPFFGADWVKNITDRINQFYQYKYNPARVYTRDKKSVLHPISGYPLENLKEILFRDQMNNSAYFYIVVFNRLRYKKPVIPEFYHMAILVPYFQDRHFHIAVFESTDKTAFDNLYLQRIPQTLSSNVIEKNMDDIVKNKIFLQVIKDSYIKQDIENYRIKSNLSKQEKLILWTALSTIEYVKEKVMIVKIPIPYLELQKHDSNRIIHLPRF